MDFSELPLVLDFGFAILLIIVLVYAVRLNGHISKLQGSKAELEKLLQGFGVATERAEEAVKRLKESSQKKSSELENAVSQGKSLHSDLAFMLSRSEKMATRLEAAVSAGQVMAHIGKGRGGASIASAGLGRESKLVRDTMPPEDLVEKEQNEQSQGQQSKGDSTKGKSKSDLLKALQGMR